ncbi:hypothetical protein FRC02_004979 [Tulasnella sp. 418]|nr:hypothetical protein FRC02_004979 [Tulasnella sp. 418]
MKNSLIVAIVACLAAGNHGILAQLTGPTISDALATSTDVDVLASSTTALVLPSSTALAALNPSLQVQTDARQAVQACQPMPMAWTFTESLSAVASQSAATNVLIYVTDRGVDQSGTPWEPSSDPALTLTSAAVPKQRRQIPPVGNINITISTSHRLLDTSFIWPIAELPVNRWYQVRMVDVPDIVNPAAGVQIDTVSNRFWSAGDGDISCLGIAAISTTSTTRVSSTVRAQSTPIATSTVVVAADPGLQTNGVGEEKGKKSNGGQIAGIVIGVVAGSVILGLLFLFMRRRRRANVHVGQSSPSRTEKGAGYSGTRDSKDGGIFTTFNIGKSKEDRTKRRKSRRAQNSESVIPGQPDPYERRTPSPDTTLEGVEAYYNHKRTPSHSGGSSAELGMRPPHVQQQQTPHIITSSRPPKARKSSSMTTFTLPYSFDSSKEGGVLSGNRSRRPSVRSRRGSESALGGEEYAMDGVEAWTGPSRSNTAMGISSSNTPSYTLARDKRSNSLPPGASYPKPPSYRSSQEFNSVSSHSPTSPTPQTQPPAPPAPAPGPTKQAQGTKTPTKRKPAPQLDEADFPSSIPPYASYQKDESSASLASYATNQNQVYNTVNGGTGVGVGGRRMSDSAQSVFGVFAGAKDGPVHYLMPDMPPSGSGR